MSYSLCDQIVGFVLEYVFNLNYLNDHSAISTPADTVIITGNTGYLWEQKKNDTLICYKPR